MNRKRLLQAALIGLYASWLIIPGWAFFHARGGLGFINGLDLHAGLQLLFPLIGLYAFTLVIWQILVATNLRWLGKLWPRIIYFHRYQGGAALTLAITHPLSILIGFGIASYLSRNFIAPSLQVYLLPAYLGLTILIITVTTASMAWYGMRFPWWHKLHRLNYLAFALLWVHSWSVGSDTRLFPLNILWIAAPFIIAISIGLRYKNDFLRWLEK